MTRTDAFVRSSLWRAGREAIPSDPFPDTSERAGERGSAAHPFDEIVVGAGLAGLVTALLFQRLGRRVVVVEARSVGAAATGNTTAKLSSLQGTHLQKIAERNTSSVTAAYVAANLAGETWLLDHLAAVGVPVERRTAYSYAGTAAGTDAVTREFEVARGFGLAVRRVPSLDLPFPTFGGVALDDQAQFDPMAVLAALAAEFRALGGVLVEGARVTRVRASDPVAALVSVGSVDPGGPVGPGGADAPASARRDVPLYGRRLYLTTGAPILDRGLYFAKLTAHRSYAGSFRVPGPLPRGMYLSVDEPSRSLRTAPATDGDSERLLVGGNGHEVGRGGSTAARVDDLVAWTQEHFPGAELEHSWSAQDYRAPHRVPFVGWLPRGRRRIFLATGFDKWGMSNAVQAALTLVGDATDATPSWARTLHHRVTLPGVVAEGLGSGAAVAAWLAKGWWDALAAPAAERAPLPAEGEGVLSRDGLLPRVTSTVDGRTCALSGVCTHLGGVVTWNDAERSWDCPLHGSRFSATGEPLEGPATRPLPRR